MAIGLLRPVSVCAVRHRESGPADQAVAVVSVRAEQPLVGVGVVLPLRSLPGSSARTAPLAAVVVLVVSLVYALLAVVVVPGAPLAAVVVPVVPPAFAMFAAVAVLAASPAYAPSAVVVELVASRADPLPLPRFLVAPLLDPPCSLGPPG